MHGLVSESVEIGIEEIDEEICPLSGGDVLFELWTNICNRTGLSVNCGLPLDRIPLEDPTDSYFFPSGSKRIK